MGRADFWKPGGWNMLCQVCGFKYKNSEMKERWDGVWCCPEDWELRQPQDFVRGVRDPMSVPYTAPEPGVTFLGPPATPLSDIVVGTPSIYIGGVLKTVGVDYTIVLPTGVVTFLVTPPVNAVIQWTGQWLHSSLAIQTFSVPFQFAQGDGSTQTFNIYWTFGTNGY